MNVRTDKLKNNMFLYYRRWGIKSSIEKIILNSQGKKVKTPHGTPFVLFGSDEDKIYTCKPLKHIDGVMVNVLASSAVDQVKPKTIKLKFVSLLGMQC